MIIIIVIVISILFSNKYTFPFIFILVMTNFLEFSYGIYAELFRFTGGVILGEDVIIIVIISKLLFKNKSRDIFNKIRLNYHNLVFVIFSLFIIGFAASLIYGFNVNVLIKVIRFFAMYIIYFYLLVYLLESEQNYFRFIKVLFMFAIIALVIQIYETITQSRINFTTISNPDNIYFTKGLFIEVPFIGQALYTWNRMLGLMPMVMFLGGYFYLRGIRILNINGLFFFIIGILSYYLGLSRMSIFLSTMMLIMFLSLNSRVTKRRNFILGISVIALVALIFLKNESFVRQTFVSRVLSVQELIRGEDSAAGRLMQWGRQYEVIKASPIIGLGFNQVNFSTLTGDLGITNLISMFGILGLTFPFYIMVATVKGIKKIKRIDPMFSSTFVSIIVPLFLGSIFTADIYLHGALMLILMMSILEYRLNKGEELRRNK